MQLEGEPESPSLAAAADETVAGSSRFRTSFLAGSVDHETTSSARGRFRTRQPQTRMAARDFEPHGAPIQDLLFAARLSPSASATIRSQGGPGAGVALVTCSTCRITTIPPQLFRVTLLRRLRLPLHLTVRSCRCGPPLHEFGHHRAACAQAAGVLSRRGWTLENVVARICREAGGRVSTNVFMRDLDGRRLEVVVDGLQLRLTPHWCVLSTGTARQWDAQRRLTGSR